MFLAIINDTYTEVKEEIQFQQNDFEVSDYVKRGLNNAMGTVGNRCQFNAILQAAFSYKVFF